MTEESALLYLRKCRLQLSRSELEILLCRHYSNFQPCAVFWRQHDQQDNGGLYRRGAEFLKLTSHDPGPALLDLRSAILGRH